VSFQHFFLPELGLVGFLGILRIFAAVNPDSFDYLMGYYLKNADNWQLTTI